ncbi:MAG: Fur family transcriptional regulator [Actinomycetota bacterium]|nr:Fur family transcriptional regulator [Actinomycetota bacterium]
MADHEPTTTPATDRHAPATTGDAELEAHLRRLRARGHRVTEPRRAVLATLVAAGDAHLSPQELAERVREGYPDVHQATVYRTLDLLQEAGLVFHSHLGHRPPVYHLSDVEHSHVVCVGCGATFDVPSDLYAPVVDRLASELGFVADPAHVSMTGRCASCADAPAGGG